MSLFQHFAYGLGNTFEDLSLQLFSSFRLVLFMNVLGLSAENSGWLILQKQLVHTILAPVCAILVDRVHIPLVSRKLGKKKTWHLIGTVLHAVVVPLFFAAHYVIRSERSERKMMIFFGILNVISGFSNTILQISHLSLVSVIAKDQIEAVELSAIRFGLSYVSGILSFVVAWVILGQDSQSQISDESSEDFMVLTAILVGVGIFSSMIFYLGTKEPTSSSPRMSLRKLSTFAAANSTRLTSFIPPGGLGEPMPDLAAGLDVVRKLSRLPRKVSRVSFCDGIRRTPTKCDENEGKMLPKETGSPKEKQHCSSSSLSNNPTSNGVVNKGFYLSVLDLYSDGDTSYVGSESAVSAETKSAPLSESETNGLNTNNEKRCSSHKNSRVTFNDEIQWTQTKCDTNEGQTFLREKEPPSENSSLSNDPYSTNDVNKGLSVSVLDLYSDDELNDKSHVCKEPVPINISAVSVEAKTDPLPKTKADRFNIGRKRSLRLPQETRRVTFSDDMRWTPTKRDTKEEKKLIKEKESPKENLHSSSSYLLSDRNSTSVGDKGLSVSVLDVYSDEESNSTSQVSKEPKPIINVSDISLETKSTALSNTVKKGSNTSEGERQPSRKKARVSICDGIRWTPAKCDQNEDQTLLKEKKPPKDYLQSRSSSLSDDPNCTVVVNKNLPVRVLDLCSDDRSDDTSHVCKEQAPTNVSSVSPETTSDSSPETIVNSMPVVDSGGSETPVPRLTKEKTIRDWIYDPRLYIVSLAYSCPWAIQVQAYSYLPLLLIYRIRLSQESIAYLPLIMSISATVSAILSKKLVQKIGSKLCFIVSTILVSSSGVITYFLKPESGKVAIYPVVILLGFGFSMMLVNSLGLGTELIGDNKKTSGFVVAFMSLVASVIGGILVMIIQELFPEQRGTDCKECGDYLRLVLSLLAIVFSAFGAFLVLLLYCINRFQGKSSSTSEDSK
ncbi:uncharacterized protein LOC114958465 [Acropora millepora]|uniref:uncharacterized protein LOC114958465 n=1 Tax=Acropora millepora TaxID=45264 RepID=UPI001CF4DD50|nr:uncharacterized protein LOC114958465 [Acropora millepora]